MGTEIWFQNLFSMAQVFFSSLVQDLRRYGIYVNPQTELRQATGLFPSYNLEDEHIYVALPDVASPVGKLQTLFMRSILGYETDQELIAFLGLFIPRLVAHEMGHALRHQYSLYDPSNTWYEEQIANQFAVAATHHRYSAAEKARSQQLIRQAMDNLAQKMESKRIATDSYYNPLYAMTVEGEIAETTLENIQIVQRLFAMRPEDLLKGDDRVSEAFVHHLEQREQIIEAFNDEYTSDVIRYIYHHLGWMYYDLTSLETHYLEEFAYKSLGRHLNLLPTIDTDVEPTEKNIQAYFLAHQACQPHSQTGSRYFYKRYRSLLLARLQSDGTAQAGQPEGESLAHFFESWDESDSDTLTYFEQFIDPTTRDLLPHRIAEHLDPRTASCGEISLAEHLASPTDVRLWQHIVQRSNDLEAQNSLERLRVLDKIDFFRSLPAEILLRLIPNLYRIKFDPGETVIWQGDKNYDVYVLLEGQLNVVVTQGDHSRPIGLLQAGAVFGEMALFTRSPRSATVSAIQPSTCLVLKASDLRYLLLQHPAMLMEITAILARRLDWTNRELARAGITW